MCVPVYINTLYTYAYVYIPDKKYVLYIQTYTHTHIYICREREREHIFRKLFRASIRANVNMCFLSPSFSEFDAKTFST